MSITDEKNGNYEISFVPVAEGIHTASIMLHGKRILKKTSGFIPSYIKESPFEFYVKKSIDYSALFSRVRTFGSQGKENGQFQNPRGLTVNSKGNIIVTDMYPALLL